MLNHVKTFVTAGLAGAVLISCAPQQQTSESAPPEATMPATAMAAVQPASGSSVTGTVTFTAQEGGGVRITAHLTGLTPGEHGFHVHESGDCSAPDATSAGGHFNPRGMAHAGPDAAERHDGDLGNITAGEDGTAEYDRVDMHLSMDGEHSVVGKAVIVHEQVDDLTTQPTGAAGARVACGVIQML